MIMHLKAIIVKLVNLKTDNFFKITIKMKTCLPSSRPELTGFL